MVGVPHAACRGTGGLKSMDATGDEAIDVDLETTGSSGERGDDVDRTREGREGVNGSAMEYSAER